MHWGAGVFTGAEKTRACGPGCVVFGVSLVLVFVVLYFPPAHEEESSEDPGTRVGALRWQVFVSARLQLPGGRQGAIY